MTDYGKQTESHGCKDMENPFKIVVANPTEEQKAIFAQMFGYLEKVYTPEPPYDPETQYLTHTWEINDDKLVRMWEVHDKPAPEPTLDERVDNLEEAVDGIISGETSA